MVDETPGDRDRRPGRPGHRVGPVRGHRPRLVGCRQRRRRRGHGPARSGDGAAREGRVGRPIQRRPVSPAVPRQPVAGHGEPPRWRTYRARPSPTRPPDFPQRRYGIDRQDTADCARARGHRSPGLARRRACRCAPCDVGTWAAVPHPRQEGGRRGHRHHRQQRRPPAPAPYGFAWATQPSTARRPGRRRRVRRAAGWRFGDNRHSIAQSVPTRRGRRKVVEWWQGC